MLDKNTSGFAAMGFEQIHRDGTQMGVIAVRGRFDLDESGNLQISEEQGMILEDEYEGKPHNTPLLRSGDLIPFKPNTDVTALVRSWPVNTEKSSAWHAGIKIDQSEYIVEINGPSHWVWKGEGWHRTEPAEVNNALVDYRIAANNIIADMPEEDQIPQNPLGIAHLRAQYMDKGKTYPAISLKSPNENHELEVDHSFEGFAPIPPFWRSRQQFAGTYDDNWLRNRHPQLPKDFDYQFYQSAHPRLIQQGFFQGDERIELGRVLPGGRNIAFQLPGLVLVADYQWIDERKVRLRLNLDGVHIDAREAPFRVDITWRAWLPICPAFFKIDLKTTTLDDLEVQDLPSYLLDRFSDEEVI